MQSLHHLSYEIQRELAIHVYDTLEAGGVFLLQDRVALDRHALDQVYASVWERLERLMPLKSGWSSQYDGFASTYLAAQAQQPAKVARIGFLAIGSVESPESRVVLDAFRQGLREHAYVEGQNIVIEYRTANGQIERFPGLATELARLQVDLIVVLNTPAARAAQQATPQSLSSWRSWPIL